MKLQQNVFYDFEDQMAIYEFDRRHKIYFKEKGVVRQGVQWTEGELADLKEQQLLKIQELDPLDQILKQLYYSFAFLLPCLPYLAPSLTPSLLRSSPTETKDRDTTDDTL